MSGTRRRVRVSHAPAWDGVSAAVERFRDAVRQAAPAVIAAYGEWERQTAEVLVHHLRRPDVQRALRECAEALDRARRDFVVATSTRRRGRAR